MEHGGEMITTRKSCCGKVRGDHEMGDKAESGHGAGPECKIQMLLNYNTIGACFVSSDWKITSDAMFAGSCIAIAMLAFFLEFLRRTVKEYDRYLIRQHMAKHARAVTVAEDAGASGHHDPLQQPESTGNREKVGANVSTTADTPPFSPNFWQQAIRAVLHTSQFTVAYFIMLIAMYYNVYVLASIFSGVLIGSYIFQYETVHMAQHPSNENREPTVCCG